MSAITVEQANHLEQHTALRIKFASLDPRGDVHSDALGEYDGFFSELPAGWTVEEVGYIETRTEATRQAWQLTDAQTVLVAVEHETGLEVLLVGVATTVAADAVKKVASWAWKRWNERRQDTSTKQDASFVIEVPRSGGDDAGSRPPIRLIVPPPVTEQDIARYLRVAIEIGQVD